MTAAADASGIYAKFGGGTGSVAIELPLILPIMFVLMFAMFQFGRIFWQYNAVQKAAADAARLLAAMPPSDMQNSATVVEAKAMAQQIVLDAAGEASITPPPNLSMSQ